MYVCMFLYMYSQKQDLIDSCKPTSKQITLTHEASPWKAIHWVSRHSSRTANLFFFGIYIYIYIYIYAMHVWTLCMFLLLAHLCMIKYGMYDKNMTWCVGVICVHDMFVMCMCLCVTWHAWCEGYESACMYDHMHDMRVCVFICVHWLSVRACVR